MNINFNCEDDMHIYDHGNTNRDFKFAFSSEKLVVQDLEGNKLQSFTYEEFKEIKSLAIRREIKYLRFEAGFWFTTMMMQSIEGIIQKIESLNRFEFEKEEETNE